MDASERSRVSSKVGSIRSETWLAVVSVTVWPLNLLLLSIVLGILQAVCVAWKIDSQYMLFVIIYVWSQNQTNALTQNSAHCGHWTRRERDARDFLSFAGSTNAREATPQVCKLRRRCTDVNVVCAPPHFRLLVTFVHSARHACRSIRSVEATRHMRATRERV